MNRELTAQDMKFVLHRNNCKQCKLGTYSLCESGYALHNEAVDARIKELKKHR